MQERLAEFQAYVNHHVLHHWGTPDASTSKVWRFSISMPSC